MALSVLRPNLLLTISAPALYLLTYAPVSVQSRILELLPTNTSKSKLVTSLTWLLAAGFGAQLNSWLTTLARNNWIWRNLGNGRGEQIGGRGWGRELAVITGGSSGIGAMTVKGLAARGIQVAILDIKEPDTKFPNVKFLKCDITSQEEVNEAARIIKESLGNPTILINNAGIAHAHTILTVKAPALRQLFDINIISQFFTLQAFLPDMIKKRKGHIITIASLASFWTCAGLVDYAATKAGVLALHEGLNQELKWRYDAPEIKTSIVHPIYVRTGLISSYEAALKKAKAMVISPQQVADAVLNQIVNGRSGQIVLPGLFGPSNAGRGFPWWLQELIRDSAKGDCLEEKDL